MKGILQRMLRMVTPWQRQRVQFM